MKYVFIEKHQVEFSIKTIAASLRRQGLRAKASRKFSPVSYHEHGLPVSKNLLKQDFIASGLNQKWAGDITYLRTGVSAAGRGDVGSRPGSRRHLNRKPDCV
ncbi:hypothetical protein Pcaca05_08210 [Pectobacterium carotovorum subsp. carotovorum]|nr:hypothetical protein Pcaca05_08210 [Pectobacterium carotovorum subsp. carotovorum]